MLGRAISYPKEGAGSWKTIGIGGVLLFPLVAIFIIPMLLAMGYLVRATDAAVRGADAPAFGDWGDLLVDGIKLFVVGFVYFVVPTVLYFVGFVLTVESVPTSWAAAARSVTSSRTPSARSSADASRSSAAPGPTRSRRRPGR